jgi:hypothetical protein
MAMYELPLSVFLSENARYSKCHRPSFLRPGQTDLGALNINRIRHSRRDDGGDIFDAALIVVSGKTR